MWRYSFSLVYKGSRIRVTVDAQGAQYELLAGSALRLNPMEATLNE